MSIAEDLMDTLAFDPTEPVTPSETDIQVARELARRLAAAFARTGSLRLRVEEPDGVSETVTIPTTAFRLLVSILAEMAAGNAVRLIPHHAELTTQEAADFLNVSRPYLVRLLDQDRIPFHRVGTHRRVLFKDLKDYKAQHRIARRAALKELAQLDQELGLT